MGFHTHIVRLEHSISPFLTGLLLAFALLFTTLFYITPSKHTKHWGEYYEQMSEKPFELETGNRAKLQMRILSPLLAFVLFLRGELYIIFQYLMSLLFLALIYTYFRKRGNTIFHAFCITAVIAFSSPILSIYYFRGYTDPLSYVLIMLCLITIQKRIWPLFFTLSLFNHESNIVIIIWLFALSWYLQHNKSTTLQTLLLSILGIFLYYVFRLYISSKVTVEFSPGYYFNPDNILLILKEYALYWWLGIFEGFKLFWFFIPLALYFMWINKSYKRILFIFLILASAVVQLFVAWDTSRLIALAFPAILFSYETVVKQKPSLITKKSFAFIVFCNLLTPQLVVLKNLILLQLPFWISIPHYTIFNN